jgi:hypothetical protein
MTRQISLCSFTEVAHTPLGVQVIRNFVRGFQPWRLVTGSRYRGTIFSGFESNWDKAVLFRITGGADSTVASGLVHRAVARQTHLCRQWTCERVSLSRLGCWRKHEVERCRRFSITGFSAFQGVTDPEEKENGSAKCSLRF